MLNKALEVNFISYNSTQVTKNYERIIYTVFLHYEVIVLLEYIDLFHDNYYTAKPGHLTHL